MMGVSNKCKCTDSKVKEELGSECTTLMKVFKDLLTAASSLP